MRSHTACANWLAWLLPLQVLLGLALGGVVQRGGIQGDNEDRPEVAKPEGEAAAAAAAALAAPAGGSA